MSQVFGTLKSERRRRAVKEQEDINLTALNNEFITRERVGKLELRAMGLEQSRDKVLLLLSRGFFGRLKWMLLGR